MYDVITIGAATRDVFLSSDKFVEIKSRKFATGSGECVALGSKIEIDDMVLTTGGGATNAAATFGNLGFNTATICRIGDDSPGKDIVEDLSQFNVSTHIVRVIKRGETAYSTILTMESGERTVLVYRGTSGNFTKRDLPASVLKNTRWIYLTSLGGNLPLVKHIVNQAKKADVRIAWNPGSRELEHGLETLKPLLAHIDILNINKEEATLLTKKKKLPQIFKALDGDKHIRIITDGTNGSTAHRDGVTIHAGTTDVPAVSRTGAGDAFSSGFVAGFIKTERIEDALQIGTINAESVIQKHGAKFGLLRRWPSRRQKQTIKLSHL